MCLKDFLACDRSGGWGSLSLLDVVWNALQRSWLGFFLTIFSPA